MTSTLAIDPAPTPTTPPTTTPAERPKGRDPLLDNARYWIMLLVVGGHALQYLLDVPAARGTYTWVYAFHMPAFVLISGYVSRRYEGSTKQTRALVTTLVIPYVALNVGLDAFRAYLDGKPLDINLLDPAWTTWFLVALVAWRLSTPVWRVLRHPVLVAVGISLVAGLWQVSNVLSVHRILGLLPFYVAGMYLKPEHFDFLRRPAVRIAAVGVLVATFAWCLVRHESWYVTWLYWRDAYAADPLDADPVGGLTTRAGLLAVGFVLTAAVLAVIPRRTNVTSGWGRRTMNAYFLHGFVLVLLAHAGAFSALEPLGAFSVPVVLGVSALLGTALMSSPVERVVGPLLSPRMAWLFRRDSTLDDAQRDVADDRRGRLTPGEERRRTAAGLDGDRQAPDPQGSALGGRLVEQRDVVAAAGLREGR